MTINKPPEHRQDLDDTLPVKALSGILKTFIIIALVLSLVAAGISVILFQQLQQTRSDLSQLNALNSVDITSKINSLSGQIEHITAEQNTFQAQLMTEQENFHSRARQRRAETEAMSRKLDISNQQLLQSMNVLFKQKGREHISWVLSEVEYLLLVANHSLQLQGDVKTAITALQLADKRLLDTGDPGAIEIRSQINEEIVQLEAVEQTDLVQLAGKLSASIKMIRQLPVNFTQLNAREKVDQMVENRAGDDAGHFDQAGKTFLKELQYLVTIRKRNKPAEPMVTPREQFFLQQNLQIKLETARYALLSGKQELYTDSILEAINWLETYYDPDMKQVSLMITGLKRLLEGDHFNPILPSISHSIALLRDYQKEIGNKPQTVTDIETEKNEVKQ